MKKLNRLYNRLYAFVNGYFWLPCPICEEEFGGHERGDEFLMINLIKGKVICYKESCAKEAKRRNDTYMEMDEYGKKYFLYHLAEAK